MSGAPDTKSAAGAQADEFEVIIDETLDADASGEGDGLSPIGGQQPSGDDRMEREQRAEVSEDDDEDIAARGAKTSAERLEQRRRARQRRKEYVNALEATVGTLAQRLQALEANVGRAQATTVEQQYREATDHVRRAEALMQQAVEAGDGAKHVEAMRYRDEAISAARSLAPQVRALRNGGPVQQQPQQQAPDPELVRRAESFAKRNAWFNAKGAEQDSATLREIDAEVAREGFDPRTSDYWDELTDRARERLPHRFKVGERRGPEVGGRGEAPSPGRKTVRISPQMRQAMEEAGVWDDPKRRNKVLADHFRLQNQTR